MKQPSGGDLECESRDSGAEILKADSCALYNPIPAQCLYVNVC